MHQRCKNYKEVDEVGAEVVEVGFGFEWGRLDVDLWW